MIIVRSPLRIALGGGNSDSPGYYEQDSSGGFTVAAAIDRYVYVTVTRPFFKGVFLKYAQIERVGSVEEVQHPVVREVLAGIGVQDPQVEITSLADIPSGTGLGSSGSFTTALIQALSMYYYRHDLSPQALAAESARIEMERLAQPSGKQDHYIAAFGGVRALTYRQDGGVDVRAVRMSDAVMYELEDSLLLFFTGVQRSAADVLRDNPPRPHDHTQGFDVCTALEAGRLDELGELLNYQADRKRDLVPDEIEYWRRIGLANGAVGGKLVGAGGGGFLLFYAQDHRRLRAAMGTLGLEEVRFRFDFEGTKVMGS